MSATTWCGIISIWIPLMIVTIVMHNFSPKDSRNEAVAEMLFWLGLIFFLCAMVFNGIQLLRGVA